MKLRSVMVMGGVFSMAAIGAFLRGQERNASEPDRQEDKTAEAEIRRLYDLEHENLLRMDIEAQSQFLPDDFVCTNPFNMFIDKPTVMERMKADIIKYTAYEREYDYFRRYGDAVVVVGSETVVPAPDAKLPYKGMIKRRFTEMWVRRDGKWQKVVRHANNVTHPQEGSSETNSAWAISRVEAEIRALDQEQARAWLAKDQTALERLWSPEFVLNAPSNQILTREGVFREMRTLRLELVSMERTTERVTAFGDIMISMGVERYVPKNGPAAGVVRTQRYSNVWRREGDTWQTIARHAHVLPLDPDQPSASSLRVRE